MEGIQFLTNDRGKRTAVLIDLKKYGELWEDFYDSIVARRRASEPRESLESVKERLRRQGEYSVVFARSARKELEALESSTARKILTKIEP